MRSPRTLIAGLTMVILHGALSRLHGISCCFGTSQPVVRKLHIATAFI